MPFNMACGVVKLKPPSMVGDKKIFFDVGLDNPMQIIMHIYYC
jgi:hypothetical protein